MRTASASAPIARTRWALAHNASQVLTAVASDEQPGERAAVARAARCLRANFRSR